ncbi:MAG: UPF0182 family protein [Gemmatimonadetes bacterium]|nr:UPF0182 family protein [Gemmatimonadota bacterium]
MRRRLVLIAAIAAIGLLVIGFPTLVRLLADWYWFKEIGFQRVFLKTLGVKVILGLGAGLFAFGFLYANLRYAQRGVVPHPVLFKLNPDVPAVDITRLFRRLAIPVAAALSFLIGLACSAEWLTVLSFLNRSPFDVADPVFQRNVGYYFFTLPALTVALNIAFGLGMLSLLIVVPLYIARGDLLVRQRVTVEPSAQTHIGMLIAFLFVTTALRLVLVRIPSLLSSPADSRFLGASYADLMARLPMLRVSAAVALVAAVAVIWAARQRRLVRTLTVSLAAYFGVTLVTGVLAAALHRLVVQPNELEKETPQLRHHIAATRRAWGLDQVEVRDIGGEAQLTLANIRANSGTIKNVRLWDRDPLLQTFGQLQEIRTYYDFVSVDDDRYVIDGEYRQVLLSPRELNTASLPTRNFINERLTFTHGMGLTLSPVNQVTQEGLPVLFIQDLPPVSHVSLTVRRPAIYYGELSSDYVFVNTGQPEFDFPSGDSSAVTTYAGAGGVAVGSLFKRLILTLRFRSLGILLSTEITNQSRVLYHRSIRERAAKALPFLSWDGDPYLVIRDDGTLQWILDAYTASTRYPYSQAVGGGINYLRNSVKVVIDAYDGTVEAYLADPGDPIIQTYDRAFPGIFRPMSTMAADLKAHLRYPEDLFRAQTALYTTYHMSEPEIFFHREDQWQMPAVAGSPSGERRNEFLRHIVMKLPGESREEFILMTPFTPRQKDNLAAWMIAGNDGDNYGKLIVYRFPRQSLVFGPTQILNRINQNPEISQQISLWDQRGSQVIRGNLLVIPIEESLIYVQALYLRAEGGRIPELRRVIVAYKNQVVMEETLEQALARLFGGASGSAAPSRPVSAPTAAAAAAGADQTTLVRQAADHYDRAIAAQRVGDWATYGAEIARVGELLRRLRGQ